jgi:glucose/arabinose dehydrogenase
MTNSIKTFITASILIILCFGVTAFGQTIKSEIFIPPSPYPISDDAFSVSTVTEGFSIPYGIAVLNDNEYFVTDRLGKLFHFQHDKLTVVSGVPMVAIVVHTGKAELVHGGLMDISLHPHYATNSWVYFSYISVDCFANVARCKIQNNAISEFQIIFATKNQNVFGNGMRIVWEDDSHFFLNVGGSAFSTKDYPILVSQDLTSEGGKIHRLMDDGSIPSDNPILNGSKSPTTIWTYGHRDVQGLYYDPSIKALFGAEHGPKGGDEFNIIKKGNNYGWPLFSYGIHYSGVGVSIISEDSAAAFTTLPEHYWTVPSNDGGNSIAPACLIKATGSSIPAWNDHFLIGSLSFKRLLKYNRATHKTFGLNVEGRIRTIKQLPGGDFIALIERSNLTDTNGKIIRIRK